MKTLWPSTTPGFPLSGFILQDKSSQLYLNGKNQFVCLFSSFAICLTQQMPTCHTSRGEGFSDIQSHCWRRRIGVLSLQRNHNKHFWHLLIFMSILLLLLLLFYYLKQLGEEGLKEKVEYLCSVQFSSVTQSCLTLWDPMNHSTPGLPVYQQLPEFTQTHASRVGDAIQASHPLSSPSPSAPNPSQHKGIFQWVNSSHEVAKVLEFQLQHQSFQWTPRTDLL